MKLRRMINCCWLGRSYIFLVHKLGLISFCVHFEIMELFFRVLMLHPFRYCMNGFLGMKISSTAYGTLWNDGFFFLLLCPGLISCYWLILQLESLPQMVAGVWSDNSTLQLEATTQFRKLLSIGTWKICFYAFVALCMCGLSCIFSLERYMIIQMYIIGYFLLVDFED